MQLNEFIQAVRGALPAQVNLTVLARMVVGKSACGTLDTEWWAVLDDGLGGVKFVESPRARGRSVLEAMDYKLVGWTPSGNEPGRKGQSTVAIREISEDTGPLAASTARVITKELQV